MPHRFHRPMSVRRLNRIWCLLVLLAVLVFPANPGLGEDCPDWSYTGQISSGDDSTVSGTVELWSTCCGAPAGHIGDYPANTPIEISGSGETTGPGDEQWYARHGDYCAQPPSGFHHCERPPGENCGTCTGAFDIKLYATHAAISGTVTVKPVPEEGLAGIEVWISGDPSGSGKIIEHTDENGYFEFLAESEPERSNNWSPFVGVDCPAEGGPGTRTYYAGSGSSAALEEVTVSSSQLSTVELTLPPPDGGGGEWPEKRGGSNGCGGYGGGGGGGWNEGGGGGSGSGSGGGSGGPEPPNSCDPGQPVNVQTGNVYFDQADVSASGVMGLGFVRSYNSLDAYHNTPSDMSRGWSHSYSRALTFPDSRSITFFSDDAVPIYFQDLEGDDVYDAAVPATERTQIILDGGEYRRVFPGGAYEVYDTQGRLTSIVDVAGNALTLGYDSSGRLMQVTDPGGRFLRLSYGTLGRLVTLSVGADVVASYGYDTSGLLQTVGYSDGSGYVFVSDGVGQILRVEDKAGRAIESHAYSAGMGITSEIADGLEKLTFVYEPWGTTVTDALGNITTYDWRWVAGMRRVTRIEGPCTSCGPGGGDSKAWTYDEDGRIVAHQRNDEDPSSYTWNAEGRVELVTDPIGRTSSYTYDSEGRMLTAATPGGGLVTYTYGPYGPLTVTEKVTEATTRTTTYTYTGLGQIETVTDPRGKTTTYAYDATGKLESVTDPLDHTTTFSYDAMGRRTAVTDELDRTTTTSYDGRGRVVRVTRPDDTHTDYAYDQGGRRTSATDPLGRTTRSIYDRYGRLAEVVDPAGGVTGYAYDVLGRLVSITDPREQTTAFEYDERGRMEKVTYPGGAFESFTYDADGHLETKTDRKGVVTTYVYDDLGRLTGKTYSDGTPAVSYTYDLAGRLETATNGSDTLSWTYDLAGQVVSESSSANGSVVAYTYDLGGNRINVSLDGQLFASYGHDDASRLTGITRSAQAFGFGYDGVNRRTSMTYPNGITTSYGYDDMDRLVSLSAVLGGSTTVTSFGHTYDAAGNRTRKQQLDYNEDYAYDELSRLRGVERTGGLAGHWHYEYDGVGNRTVNQHDTTVGTATYDERNQLLSTTGGGTLRVRGVLDEPGTAVVDGQPARMLAGNTFEATIDAVTGSNTFTVEATDTSGNVTSQSYEVSVSGTGASFVYDDNGNLTQRTEGTDVWTYEWDAENRLVLVERNSLEVARFEYDPLGRRIEKVAGGVTTTYVYDGQDILDETKGATSFKYVHGPGIDEPLAREDALGALTYYHADGLGSVLKRTDQTGAVVHANRYDAWGNLEAGSAQEGYAYTAREWDPETNLYYYRARYYDPKVGRFISEDPIGFAGGDANFFAYVGNSPASRIDPAGLCECGAECTSGTWILDLNLSGMAGAAFGSYATGGSVTNGTLRCMDNPTITRDVVATCRIIHGFFVGAGAGSSGSLTTQPDVGGVKCAEDLKPFSSREKFFSVGPFGGSAPMGKKMPTSLSLGWSLGAGVGMMECHVEPQ